MAISEHGNIKVTYLPTERDQKIFGSNPSNCTDNKSFCDLCHLGNGPLQSALLLV